MSRYGWRPCIESALRLNLASMLKSDAIAPESKTAGYWQFTRNSEVIASVGFDGDLGEVDGVLDLSYRTTIGGEERNVRSRIPLETTEQNFGGRRWWFVCPLSGARALFLYKFNGIELFCHPTAVRPLPTYYSQRISGIDRVLEKRRRIRRNLGDTNAGWLDELRRPKGMRQLTFQKILARDAVLAEIQDSYIPPFVLRLESPSLS